MSENKVNRISVGIQTFNEKYLEFLNRKYDEKEIIKKISLIKNVGFKNINVDLMLALPGQTIAKLEKGLKQVIDLQPEHISLYSLIIEDGTKIEKMLKNNEITLPDENIERKMFL